MGDVLYKRVAGATTGAFFGGDKVPYTPSRRSRSYDTPYS